eukprot:TRINITY_DN74716_c0_g1_i1.p1 TRINITY_DN74716_c0_g1~~TRINITY_DN74716_c0_g1_i1.p1  ORF type:complete len:642 (+),score=16.37 TRINITY_DN74716_c0_g1_i1:39-1964(+)
MAKKGTRQANTPAIPHARNRKQQHSPWKSPDTSLFYHNDETLDWLSCRLAHSWPAYPLGEDEPRPQTYQPTSYVPRESRTATLQNLASKYSNGPMFPLPTLSLPVSRVDQPRRVRRRRVTTWREFEDSLSRQYDYPTQTEKEIETLMEDDDWDEIGVGLVWEAEWEDRQYLEHQFWASVHQLYHQWCRATSRKRFTPTVRQRISQRWTSFLLGNTVLRPCMRMKVLPWRTLKQMTELPSFHSNKTVFLEDVWSPSTTIVFISHRWLTEYHPDGNNNEKCKTILHGMKLLLQNHLMAAEENVYIWLDWCCIDQDCALAKKKNIFSLPYFIATCSAMLIPVCTSGGGWGGFTCRYWCQLELSIQRLCAKTNHVFCAQLGTHQLWQPALELYDNTYTAPLRLTGGSPSRMNTTFGSTSRYTSRSDVNRSRSSKASDKTRDGQLLTEEKDRPLIQQLEYTLRRAYAAPPPEGDTVSEDSSVDNDIDPARSHPTSLLRSSESCSSALGESMMEGSQSWVGGTSEDHVLMASTSEVDLNFNMSNPTTTNATAGASQGTASVVPGLSLPATDTQSAPAVDSAHTMGTASLPLSSGTRVSDGSPRQDDDDDHSEQYSDSFESKSSRRSSATGSSHSEDEFDSYSSSDED